MKVRQWVLSFLFSSLTSGSILLVAPQAFANEIQAVEPFNVVRASGDVNIHIISDPGNYAVRLIGGEKESDVSGNIGNVIDGLLGGFGKKKD